MGQASSCVRTVDGWLLGTCRGSISRQGHGRAGEVRRGAFSDSNASRRDEADSSDSRFATQMINVAYVITTAVYLFSGALGYLMFGNTVMDEVRSPLSRSSSTRPADFRSSPRVLDHQKPHDHPRLPSSAQQNCPLDDRSLPSHQVCSLHETRSFNFLSLFSFPVPRRR